MAKTIEGSPCKMHELLVSYLYSEVTPEEARRMENHIKQCAACAEELQAFEGVRTMLRQWRIEDVPVLRVETGEHKKPFRILLGEILSIAPLWAKAAAGAVAALLVLAVMGTDVSIGPGGFTFRANLFRRTMPAAQRPSATPVNGAQSGLTKDEVEQIINREILAREKQQQHDLTVQLAAMQEEFQRTRSSDVAKLEVRLQAQRDQIKSIQNDIDRREGLDVADILFSSAGSSAAPDGGQ